MAADVIDLGGPGTQLRVTGLRSTFRSLQDAGASAEDLKNLMAVLGALVVQDAQPRARRDTGALAGSIRAGRGKTKAVVRAGGARIPYAGVQHYGWAARSISPNPFLVQAIQSQQGAILAALDDGIKDLLREAGLL